MAWTQTEIDELRKNMGKGIQTAMINGEMVTFRSLDEMSKLMGRMERSINPTSNPSAVRTIHPTTSRGL